MRSRASRFASAGAIAAAIALGVAANGDAAAPGAAFRRDARRARRAARLRPARLAADLLRHAGPVRERRPVQRPRRALRHARRHRLRPDRHRLLPRRRPEGARGRLRDRERPRAHPRPRLHRGLGHAAGEAEAGDRGLGRLPRLLGPRLHHRRPAPRHRGRLRRARRLRAPARAEGLPRRRRQPHGGRDPPAGRLVLGRHDALPRLQRPRLRPGALRRRPHVPVPEPAQLPADAEPLPRRRAAEEAGVAERRHRLPQPRRHQLRLVLRALLRAGRLLRARRPLHRAAAGGARAGRPVGVVDREVQGRRVPDRHGAARRRGVLRRLGAADHGGRARRRCPGLPALRRGLHRQRDRPRPVRARPRAPEPPRLPAPGGGWPGSRAATRARAGSPRGSATTTTSASPTAARRCRRRSSATTTWAAPR